MRKTRLILMCCTILLSLGLICGFTRLEKSRNLSYTWKTVYGDISAASGIEIMGKCQTRSNTSGISKYLWDITYKVTSSEITMNASSVYKDVKNPEYWASADISIDSQLCSSGITSEISAAAKKCYDLLQEAKKMTAA